MRALAKQLADWVNFREATTTWQLNQFLRSSETDAVVMPQWYLRREDGMELLRDLRYRYPTIRRCLLATSPDLDLITQAVHDDLLDSLIYIPLIKEQFLRAITPVLASEKPKTPQSADNCAA